MKSTPPPPPPPRTQSLLFFFLLIAFCSASPPLRGIHPLDAQYFELDVIKCKDGSKSFTRDRVNDDFCDCVDGTDEPGTSACVNGKFYCRNLGSTPRFLFSSRVNDHICDCCDGNDEYDGVTDCPNTCIMGGNIEYKVEYRRITRSRNAIQAKESNLDRKIDLILGFKDLKLLTLIQLIVIVGILAFWLFYRRIRSRRRRLH